MQRHDFPIWGIETSRKEWNGWSYYRHGQRDYLDRYVVKPRDGIFCYGLTVGDIVIGVTVGAFIGLLFYGFCFGSWIDALGW